MFKSPTLQRLHDEFQAHVRPEIKELVERDDPMTWDEYNELRMNSYERKALLPKLDDRAVFHLLKYCLSQSRFEKLRRYELAGTYDEAVTCDLLPEMMLRLEKTYGPEKIDATHH